MNVVITGASSGIGLAAVKLFCENGWNVYGLSRQKPAWEHENFTFVECDVSSWESVQKARGQVKKPVDLLVPNAGIYLKAPFAELSVADFDKMMAVNVRGVYLTIKAFLDSMLEKESGTIVVISSTAGLNPLPLAAVYAASKHAIHGYANSIRAMCAKKNVRISIVCPGGVNTPIREKERTDYLPPEEIAKTIMFIATCPANTVVDQIIIEPRVQAIGDV